jgi:serine protease Do
MSTLRKIGIVGITAAAFTGGVVFASALDFTPKSDAQPSRLLRKSSDKDGAANAADLGGGFVAVAEKVTPAVVSIRAERDPRRRATADARPAPRGQNVPPGLEEFFRQFEAPRNQPRESGGTGFIVSKDGYILTNNHVVEGADRIRVTLIDRREFKARLIGRDPQTDVAVLKIDGGDLPVVTFGDDQTLRVGEWVVAVGNPLGLDFTVTAGIVSAKGRSQELRDLNRNQYRIQDFIQTDAAINPGNSGGPLVNARGEAIGVNSAIASQTGFYSGYGFAIPITLARDVMDDIIKHGRVRRAIIGVSIDDVTPEDAAVAGLKDIRGVKVLGYSGDDSPAKIAGLEPNDVIVKVDGKETDRASTMQRIIRKHEPGDVVDLEVMRYGTRKAFKVKLAEAPGEATVAKADTPADSDEAGASAEKLGITVEPVPTELAEQAKLAPDRRGLRVLEVSPAGPARERLFPNDIIYEVVYPSKTPIKTTSDLQKVLARLKAGEYVSLNVLIVDGRGGQQSRVVNLRIGGE